MREFIQYISTLDSHSLNLFLCGGLFALVLVFILLFLFAILKLVFRIEKKIAGVTLSTPHGSLFTAAAAIGDLVRSLQDDFSGLTISKVVLTEEKGDLVLRIKIFYIPGNGSVLEQAEMFQSRILDSLKTSFGIENIKRIDLKVPHGN